MKNSVIKRVWAWLLVACMLFTMVPAFAEEAAPVTEAAEEVAEVVEPAAEAAEEEIAEPEAEEPAVEPDETPAAEPQAPAPVEAPEDENVLSQDEVLELYGTPEDAGLMPIAAATCKPGTHHYDEEKTKVKYQGNCQGATAQERTTVLEKWCTVCESWQLVTDGIGHQFVQSTLDADCEHGKRTGLCCSRCGAEDPNHPMTETGEPLTHQFTLVLSKPVKDTPTKADNDSTHDYRVKDATCTEPGTKVLQCTRPGCNYGDWSDTIKGPLPARKVETISALGHEASSVREKLDATCEAPAKYVWKCVRYDDCKTIVREEVCTDSNKADPLGHSFGLWEPVDKDEGMNTTQQHKRVCANGAKCTLLEATEYADCTSTVTGKTEATCAKAATQTWTCSVCAGTFTETIGKPDASKHDWEWYVADKSQTVSASDAVCESTIRAIPKCKNKHDGEDFWGEEQDYVVPHEYTSTDTAPASCFKNGVRTYTCSRDGKCTGEAKAADKYTEVIPATGNHDWDTSVVYPATCVDDMKVVHYCKTDGCTASEVLLTYEGSALGHNYYDADGKLIDANHLVKNAAEQYASMDALLKDPTEANLKFHKNPTCTEDGWVIYRCTCEIKNYPSGDKGKSTTTWKCEGTTEDHELTVNVEHSGHVAGKTERLEHDCLKNERQVTKCEVCGEEIPELSYDIPNGNPATGHKYKDQDNGHDGWTPDSGNTEYNDESSDQASAKATAKHYRICINDWCTGITKGTGDTVANASDPLAPNAKNNKITQACTFVEVPVAATCTTPAHIEYQCTVCGYRLFKKTTGAEPDETSHIRSAEPKPKTGAEPTCTKDGVGEYVCTECGAVLETVKMPAQHLWKELTEANINDDNKADVQKGGKYAPNYATCSKEGYHWEVCTRPECSAPGTSTVELNNSEITGATGSHAVRKVTEQPTGNHEWEAVDVRPATCVDNAYEGGYQCTICKQSDPTRPAREIPNTSLGHHYDKGVITKPASCTEPGVRTFTCDRVVYIDADGDGSENDEYWKCSDKVEGYTYTEEIPKLDHKPGPETPKAADCTNDQRYEIACTVCKEVLSIRYVEGGAKATGHNFTGIWSYNGDGTHSRYCSKCKQTITLDCTDDAGVPNDANCTNPAGTTYTCILCGRTRFEKVEGSEPVAGAHNMVLVPYVTETKDQGPTCDTRGVGQYVCSLCGYKGGYASMPAQHSWNAGAVTTEPTCTEPGVRTFTCTKGAKCSEYDKATGKAATRTEEIPATGHAWDEGIVNRKPTCNTPGEKTVTCMLCGEHTTQEIPTTGHDMTTTAEPDDNGVANIKYCKNCGSIEFVSWLEGIEDADKDCTKVQKTVNGVKNTLSHTEIDKEEVEPTPEKPGHEAGKFCTRCEKYTDDSKDIPYEPGECTEHSWSEPEIDGSFTCMVQYCTKCGTIKTPIDSWLDDTPEEERDCTKVYIEFNGEKHYATHDTEHLVTVPGKEPTATEPGLTDGKKCPSCGQWIEEPTEIPATGGETTTKVRTTKRAVLRDSASNSGKMVRVTSVGETFEVVSGPTDGFYEITDDGKTCYIQETYCEVVK